MVSVLKEPASPHTCAATFSRHPSTNYVYYSVGQQRSAPFPRIGPSASTNAPNALKGCSGRKRVSNGPFPRGCTVFSFPGFLNKLRNVAIVLFGTTSVQDFENTCFSPPNNLLFCLTSPFCLRLSTTSQKWIFRSPPFSTKRVGYAKPHTKKDIAKCAIFPRPIKSYSHDTYASMLLRKHGAASGQIHRYNRRIRRATHQN